MVLGARSLGVFVGAQTHCPKSYAASHGISFYLPLLPPLRNPFDKGALGRTLESDPGLSRGYTGRVTFLKEYYGLYKERQNPESLDVMFGGSGML